MSQAEFRSYHIHKRSCAAQMRRLRLRKLRHMPTFTQLESSGAHIQIQDFLTPEAQPFTLDILKPIALKQEKERTRQVTSLYRQRPEPGKGEGHVEWKCPGHQTPKACTLTLGPA